MRRARVGARGGATPAGDVAALLLLVLGVAAAQSDDACRAMYASPGPDGRPLLFGGVAGLCQGKSCMPRDSWWGKVCQFGEGSGWGICSPDIANSNLELGRTLGQGEAIKLTPCDLLPYLRGRTLWVIGDSYAKQLYRALQCFLMDFWDHRECNVSPDASVVQELYNLPVRPGQSKCFHLVGAGGGRVCVVHTVLLSSLLNTNDGDPTDAVAAALAQPTRGGGGSRRLAQFSPFGGLFGRFFNGGGSSAVNRAPPPAAAPAAAPAPAGSASRFFAPAPAPAAPAQAPAAARPPAPEPVYREPEAFDQVAGGGVLPLLRSKVADPQDIFYINSLVWHKPANDKWAPLFAPALFALGQYYQATKKQWPHLLFRESPAEHPKNLNTNVCLPMSGYYFDPSNGDLRVDASARVNVPGWDSGETTNALAKSVLQRYGVPVDPGFNISVPLYDNHVGLYQGDLDCLHYCHPGAPEMWLYYMYKAFSLGKAGVSPLSPSSPPAYQCVPSTDMF